MASEPPEIPSRSRRLLAYLRYNRARMVVDAALLVAWVAVTSMAFDWLAFPNWLFYVVLFVGVVVYSQVTPTWNRPYRSPD